MINKISLPKVSVSAPKKQIEVSSERKNSKAVEEKIFKSPAIHWEPCLTTAPIFIGARNMEEALAAYKKMQSLL